MSIVHFWPAPGGSGGGTNSWPNPANVLETETWFENGVLTRGELAVPDPNACIGERRSDVVPHIVRSSLIMCEEFHSEVYDDGFSSKIEAVKLTDKEGCC